MVSTTLFSPSHEVGMSEAWSLLGDPHMPSSFHCQQLAAASPTLGSTLSGGTNCAHVVRRGGNGGRD